MSVPPRPAASVAGLLEVLTSADGAHDSLGDDGDPVDVLSHSLQCAAELARVAPHDPELQVAGLVHDLGHVLAPGRSREHADVGAVYVGPLLGPRVARLVALHVPAKRYLVTTEPAYGAALTEGSVRSLAVQGGALTDAERAVLDADPFLADALTLRRADEAAKVPGATVAALEEWVVVIAAVVERQPAHEPGPGLAG